MTGVGPMHEAAVQQPAWVLLAYLIAGICFILALRGLSGPESSRRGNRLGMVGMTIAVVTTLYVSFLYVAPTASGGPYGQIVPNGFGDRGQALIQIIAAIALGGGIGLITARK